MKKRTVHLAIWFFIGSLLVAVGLTLWAGSKKIPPELAAAESAAAALRSSEAVRYLPERCRELQRDYGQVMNRWEQELAKWIWFRRYDPFIQDFRAILADCHDIQSELSVMIQNRSHDLTALYNDLSDKVQTARHFTITINEGRVARKELTRSELALAQSRISLKAGKLDLTEKQLEQAKLHLRSAGRNLSRILNRYRNDEQIHRWQSWINETVAESRRRNSLAVVVSKIDRQLVVYRNGSLIHTFTVGLGRNGLSDKRHSGDNATPEGRYRISRKNPNSLYYKALLLNYPNDEDRRTFQRARAQGLIPARVGIGGLIEIHGGGITFMTRGCIALENEDMDTLYNLLPQDTPVTIVGSSQSNEHLISVMEEISSDKD